MTYMGSKAKIAKILVPFMLQYRKPDQWWVEPFVGSGSVIEKVGGKRLGNDSNPYLIALLSAMQSGYNPPDYVSEELYYQIKRYPENYPPELVGFVGFGCSFGGKWFGGYARNKGGDNYADRSRRSLLKQAPKLQGVIFKCGDYQELTIPPKSLIYCDPPYASTTKYSKISFDHESFWQWCRKMAKKGHTVFISEYQAPEDFACVLEIPHKTLLDKNSPKPRIERLFRPIA